MEKDGQTTGILYGFVNLADFSDSISTIAYDGNVQIYVADGETGDFLVDTWHDELGNIYDADIWIRKVKPGYDFHEMKTAFAAGKSGHIAFWSNTAGEYFYSCYMPVGIDRWMIQITVLESVAFAKAIQVRKVMILVAALELLTFPYILYGYSTRHEMTPTRKISSLRRSFICMMCSRLYLTRIKILT